MKSLTNIYIENIISELETTKIIVSHINDRCLKFVEELQEILKLAISNISNIEYDKFQIFYSSFGRGQQYLSMVKKYQYMLNDRNKNIYE